MGLTLMEMSVDKLLDIVSTQPGCCQAISDLLLHQHANNNNSSMDSKVAEEENLRSSDTTAAAAENVVDLGYTRVNINTETGVSVLSS